MPAWLSDFFAGSSLIIVLGLNFEGGKSPSVRIGQTGCEQSEWKSATAVTCKSVGTKYFANNGITVTIVSNDITKTTLLTRHVTYDLPVVSGVSLTNGPSTGCSSLSVVGQRMGLSGYSGGVREGRIVSGSLGETGIGRQCLRGVCVGV